MFLFDGSLYSDICFICVCEFARCVRREKWGSREKESREEKVEKQRMWAQRAGIFRPHRFLLSYSDPSTPANIQQNLTLSYPTLAMGSQRDMGCEPNTCL